MLELMKRLKDRHRKDCESDTGSVRRGDGSLQKRRETRVNVMRDCEAK